MSRVLTQEALADLADVPATSRWVRSGRLRLHLLDYGGDGVPMVVVPGITSPAISMDFVARELTDLVRPIVLDNRGRGLSDAGASYTLADYTGDVLAVLAALDLREPLLLGHSMGARIVAAVAAGGAVTRGTIVVDPPTSGPGRDPYPTTLEAFLGQLAEARRGTDADEVARAWPRWPRREQELRARWLASCDEEAIRASHAAFESEDFFTVWPKVPSPTVFMFGAQSPVVPPPAVAEARTQNPHATFVEVSNAAHMIFWDNPKVALPLLRRSALPPP